MITYKTYADLFCACGETRTFTGENATDATKRARGAGWHACGQSAVCPKCLAKWTERIKANLAAKATT